MTIIKSIFQYSVVLLLAGVVLLPGEASACQVADDIGRQIVVSYNPVRVVALLPDVRNSRVDIVDSNIFDRPTPRRVDALEQLGRTICR